MMGTESAPDLAASDSDEERTGCVGADCGGRGRARVGGFARDAERGERAKGLRARMSSTDTLRESSSEELGEPPTDMGTSGSGP